MELKKIVKYHNTSYCIMVPIYYENSPSWRKWFIGTKEECEDVFNSVPDFKYATQEENKKARHWKMQEYLFLLEIGKTEKANAIKLQYCL